MSGAVLLALVGALLPLIGGLFGARAPARVWRASAGLAAALIVAGVWWTAAPRGEFGHPITAEAVDAAGAPVSTVLVLQHEGGRRQVRRLPLRQPVEGAEYALWAGLILGLLGASLQLRRQDLGPAWLAPALPFAGAAAAAVSFARVGGSTSGEAGVRAWLAQFQTGAIQSFTVPDLPWSAQPEGTVALAVAAVAAGLALASALVARSLPERSGRLGQLLTPTAGAILASAAVMWRIFEVGGLPWRGAEGALWAVAGILAVAGFERRSAFRTSSLVAAAVALAAVALGA